LKLIHSAQAGLLILFLLYAAAFCSGQSVPQTQTSDPVPSTQAPATSPAASPAKTDTPGDQPPAQVQDQNSPGQQNTDQQNTKPQNTKPEDTKTTEDQKKVKDDRMFYVMPNYLTVQNESEAKPLTWKEKFVITAKGTFDPYEFVIVGVVSGIRQAENSYPVFGQGAEGYGKRYGAAFADQVDGNLMVGGVFPTILKTDPRYFRLGTGRMGHRFFYAISRVIVARKDSGGSMFNIPEFAGNATAIAISNAYYPSADRGVGSNFTDWGVQMGIDAFGNELKEFWPDVHGYLQKRHERKLEKEKQNN
jgi:hypothetical protein